MAELNQNRQGADILRSLLGLDGSKPMLTRGNEALVSGANVAVEPIRQLANLLGTASVAPAQDVRQPNVIESMRLEAAKSALKKKTKMEAEEALASPQGEEALANFIQQNEPQEEGMGQTDKATTTQPQPTQQPSPQQGVDISGQLGLLQGLLSAGGKLAGPVTRARALQNLLLEQELKGEKPLQKGDKEKLKVERYNKLLDPQSQKPLSAESAKVLGNVNSGLEQLNALSTAFEQDPSLFTKSKISQTGQQVALMRDDLVDILGRLRSGGAINKEEWVNFNKQIPSRGAISGRIEKPETVRLKIQKLKKLFNEIKSKVEPVDTGLSERVIAARLAGYSDEEIMESLSNKGVL